MCKNKFIRLISCILSFSIFQQILFFDSQVYARSSVDCGSRRIYSDEDISKPYDPSDITINREEVFEDDTNNFTNSTLKEKMEKINNYPERVFPIEYEFKERDPDTFVKVDVSFEWLFNIINVLLLGIPALVLKLYKYFTIEKLYELPGEEFENLSGKVSGNFKLIEIEGATIRPTLCLRNVDAVDRYNMILNTIRQARLNYKLWQKVVGLAMTLDVKLPAVMYGDTPTIATNSRGEVTYDLNPTTPMANAYKFELPGVDGTVEFAFTADKIPPGHIVWLILPYKGKDNYARVANICIMPDQKFAYVCEG